ncbi:MAG TPA: GNAT family N-acetyltransferase [Sphingobacteriaceae bacterium]
MNVKSITKEDINNCAHLIGTAYNNPPWNYKWEPGRATRYLNELFESSRFTGFCIYEGDIIAAAMFAHVKTWWINDLLMIDELFVSPQHQGKGYGQKLIDTAKKFCTEHNIGSITLITNAYMPAASFYKKNGFLQAEQYTLMFNEND